MSGVRTLRICSSPLSRCAVRRGCGCRHRVYVSSMQFAKKAYCFFFVKTANQLFSNPEKVVDALPPKVSLLWCKK